MSGAIAKALPTCIRRTPRRVGFALGAETFTLIYKPTVPASTPARPPVSAASTGFGWEADAQSNPNPGFSAIACSKPGWAKRFYFRYNSKTQFMTMRP